MFYSNVGRLIFTYEKKYNFSIYIIKYYTLFLSTNYFI